MVLPTSLLGFWRVLRNTKRISKEASSDVASGEFDPELQQSSTNGNAPVRSRPGLLPRDDERLIVLDEEAIFAATQHHKEYTLNATTVQNLKQYNDPSAYNLPELNEHNMLRLEIERLSEDVRSTKPFLFESDGLLTAGLKDAYEDIARIADQIKVAMGIVRLDNAAVSLQYCKVNVKDTIDNYNHASRRLRGRFDLESAHGHTHNSAPTFVGAPVENSELFHAFVDYITSTVARTLMRTAQGDYWSQQTLSCLASCAVKLKILSANLEVFARQSISDAAYAIDNMHNEQKQKQDASFKVAYRVWGSAELKSSTVDPLDAETDASCRYHEEHTFYNWKTWLLLRRILNDILLPEMKHARPDSFQIFNSVYCASVDGPPTLVTCDRLGEISASSDRFDIDTLYTPLRLVLANVRRIQEMSREANYPPVDASVTFVDYEWSEDSGGTFNSKRPLYIGKADDVISIIAPLALSAATASSHLGSLISFAASCTSESDPIKQFAGPPRGFYASFDITTSAWRDKERRLRGKGITDENGDVVTLAESPLRRGIQPSTNLQEYLKLSDDEDKIGARKKPDPETHKNARDKATMQRWVISEGSIRVGVRLYVHLVVACAAVILASALVIPFTVRNRILGVDPFNITLFLWLFTGLYLLVAKGRYVTEWPWHQFIHGHVICRSVEEVCEASKIDPQTVMSYLLLNEWKLTLRTRGPYNGLFTRKDVVSDAAFSINKPMHISTIMASGFIVLKIRNITGEHLIFMDVRRGRDSVNYMSTDDRIACLDLEQYDEAKDEKEEKNPAWYVRHMDPLVRRVQNTNVRVDRVLGVYIGGSSSFFG